MSAVPAWRTPLPEIFRRVFTPPPPEPIHEWADAHVLLVGEDAAEPGPYRWRKTPATRRLQELLRDPHRYCWSHADRRWLRTRVTFYAAQKSTQSGLTEAAFNGLRWRALHRPCNIIYAIDSDKEAKKIARRVLRSLQLLDPTIFTGNPDDIRTNEFLLRGMEVNFYGSGSPGNFANKQAGLIILDEIEEHLVHRGDTSTASNAKHRGKTNADGLTIALGKPKLENGPINRLFKNGNCEEYFIRCPHCAHLQHVDFSANEDDAIETPFDHQNVTELRDELTGVIHHLPAPLEPGQTRSILPMRVKFDHCKTLLGEWDLLAMEQGAIVFECAKCKGEISEHEKQSLALAGFYMPTQHGDPTTITQHVSDLLSTDRNSSLSAITREFLAASKSGAAELQGWLNNRLGKVRKLTLGAMNEKVLARSIGGREGDGFPPYARGTIPFHLAGQKDNQGRPLTDGFLIMGADIGLDYARWALGAVRPGTDDIAIVDWGNAISSNELAEIMLRRTYQAPPGEDGKPRQYRISFGYVDAKFQKTDVYRACFEVFRLRRSHHLIPAAGIGGSAARGHEFAWTQMPNYPTGFMRLTYRDFEAKNDLYIERLGKRNRRLFFPHDLFTTRGTDDPSANFPAELCREKLITPPGEPAYWDETVSGNHYGDAVKNICTGLRFHRRLNLGLPLPTAAE